MENGKKVKRIIDLWLTNLDLNEIYFLKYSCKLLEKFDGVTKSN